MISLCLVPFKFGITYFTFLTSRFAHVYYLCVIHTIFFIFLMSGLAYTLYFYISHISDTPYVWHIPFLLFLTYGFSYIWCFHLWHMFDTPHVWYSSYLKYFICGIPYVGISLSSVFLCLAYVCYSLNLDPLSFCATYVTTLVTPLFILL